MLLLNAYRETVRGENHPLRGQERREYSAGQIEKVGELVHEEKRRRHLNEQK